MCQRAMFKLRLGCGGPRRAAFLFEHFFLVALCFLACIAAAAAVDAILFLLLLSRWECVCCVFIVLVVVIFVASIASSVFCFDVRVLDKVNNPHLLEGDVRELGFGAQEFLRRP